MLQVPAVLVKGAGSAGRERYSGYLETTNAQTQLKLISSNKELIPVWEQLATDYFEPWQVFPYRYLHPIPAY